MDQKESGLFDSVILAGGFGTRLRPLTDTVPKPMLKVAGMPVFLRAVRLLRENGFLNTAVTTMYLPEQIEDAARGESGLEFFRESSGSPLGSAGAVAALCGRMADVFCVISGDAVCDFPLAELKTAFTSGGCAAAILLARVSDAGEYGTVCLENGLVTGFCEKPSAKDTLSDLVNTGIYFFRRDRFEGFSGNTDFARDVFPALMQRGEKIAGYLPEGRWFDIGSFYDYHRCNMFYTGGENARGTHISLHPEATVERCVISDGVTVGRSAVYGSIIGENAVIGNGCFVAPGCVIGAGAELRDGAATAPGTVIERNAAVFAARGGGFPGASRSAEFGDESINGLSAGGGFFALGAVLAARGDVFVCAESKREEMLARELACGAAASGSECAVCVGLSAAAAAFAAREFRADTTVHIALAGDAPQARVFGADGMPVPRETARSVMHSRPKPACGGGLLRDVPRSAVAARYIRALKAFAGERPQISFADGRNEAFARECAEVLGAAGGGAVYSLSADGAQVSAEADGREITYWQLLTAYCVLSGKHSIALPNDAPRFAEALLRSHAVIPCFYGDGKSEARTQAAAEPFARDGILLAFALESELRRRGETLGPATDGMAAFTVLTRSVYAEKERMTGVIAALRSEYGGGRCVGFDIGDGHISIFPSASGAFRVIAEAYDSETAEEISLRAAEMVERMTSGAGTDDAGSETVQIRK